MINDINQKNQQTQKSNMSSLLKIMQRMHIAAKDNDWHLVGELDQLRNNLLSNLNIKNGATIENTGIKAKEILTLDKEVMALAGQALDTVSTKIHSVSRQTAISQKYQLNV